MKQATAIKTIFGTYIGRAVMIPAATHGMLVSARCSRTDTPDKLMRHWMKTLWLAVALVWLPAPLGAQSNDGCDVLKIAGARLVAATVQGAVNARLASKPWTSVSKGIGEKRQKFRRCL